MLTPAERQAIIDEINAGTFDLENALDDIATEQKGEGVRRAIYGGIMLANENGTGGPDAIARQKIGILADDTDKKLTAVGNQMAQFIAGNSGTMVQSTKVERTVLYSDYTLSRLHAIDYTLAAPVTDFDEIEIVFVQSSIYTTVKIPIRRFTAGNRLSALPVINSQPGTATYYQDGSGSTGIATSVGPLGPLSVVVVGIESITDTQLTLNSQRWTWDGVENTHASQGSMNDGHSIHCNIYSITGIKYTQVDSSQKDAELTDMRIGADGTEYASAGEALRAQVNSVPKIDATLTQSGATADAKAVGNAVDELKNTLNEYESVFTGDVGESVQNWLDEHPEATTTVQDNSLTTAKYQNHSVSKEKLSKELFIPICIPDDYVTFNGLMDLSVAETYDLFDAYVTEGLLTKTRIGYGSANTSDAEAVEDAALPIYMYSYRNKMTSAKNYTASAYAKPILLSNAMHGNEKMGIPIMLTLLKAYKDGTNTQITSLFDDFGIDFIPVLNPYGYEQSIGTTMETVEDNVGRYNARGVDLNRNGTTCWEVNGDTRKGNAPLSECESKIIHNLAVVNGDNYSFYVDIHTERYTESEHNYFGAVTCGSTIIRSIFSTIMAKMDERMKTEYNYDMLSELNGLGITGIVNRTPMHFIDRCYAIDTQVVGCLYEAPRYNDSEIYPVKSQKFTCDLFINFLIAAVNYLKLYRPLNNSIDRQYQRNKVLQKDVLPATKDGWEYGVETDRGEFDSYTKIRTADKIQVDTYTHYDIVPSYDNLYYNVMLSNASHTKYIDWNHGQSRIYTDGYTHIRVSLSIGDPYDASNTHAINMPEFGHDYDIVVKKTDMTDVDIASDLSSSVATINYARMQKVGRMAFVVMGFTLTADVEGNTDILSGMPLGINNYDGVNNIRLFDNNTIACYDGYITHTSGATTSTLRCLNSLVSGHSIRATFMYFTNT